MLLRQKAKSAVIWSGADLLLRQGVGFAISIVLARLLVPEDFGTIALLSLFLGIAGIFVNAGFSAALIQNQDTTHVDESTVFWFNIVAGALVTAVLLGLAPSIAALFTMPVLAPLTMLMACNILVSAMGSIHSTLMTNRLDFKTPMKIGVISTLVSGGVAVYMAWAGYGVWALAGQALTSTLIGTALLWIHSTWRPQLVFSNNSFRRLFGFSGYVFAANLLEAIYQNGYTLLVGKFFGVRDLGFYNRANSTQQFAAGFPTGIVSRVTFPLYSSLNKDVKKLRSSVRLSIRSIMLVTSPIMFGLAALSGLFVQTVFGDQWIPVAPILQVLCFVGLFLPIQQANVSVLQAQGYADINLRINLLKKVTGIIFLGAGSIYGVMGVAWGCVIQTIAALLINSHYTHKFLGYSLNQQIKDCWPSLFLGAMMATVIVLADILVSVGGVAELSLLIILGAAFYLASNMLLGIGSFKEVVGFIRREARV